MNIMSSNFITRRKKATAYGRETECFTSLGARLFKLKAYYLETDKDNTVYT